MNIIDEYRKKLAELNIEVMKLLGDIADVEQKLDILKKEVAFLYEKIDECLDKE